MAIEIVDLEDEYISRRGSNKRNPISVEAYTREKRDFKRAISSSLRSATQSVIDLSKDEDDEVQVLDFNPFPSKKRSRAGESSKARQGFTCEICVATKPQKESFNIKGCTHFYCADCISKYVGSKFRENVHIGCPVSGCPGLLEPEYCRQILPPEVFERWGDALCESIIPEFQKFYCPYKDCLALLINDCDGGRVVIDKSECPYCRRLFCFQCRVQWHSGIDCVRFLTLNKDEREKEDIMLMKLAEDRQWQRCPRCKFYIERTEGCPAMRCRCGCNFCYHCGGAPCHCWRLSGAQFVASYVARAPTMRRYGEGADPPSTQQYHAAATSFPARAAVNPLNPFTPYLAIATMNPYLAQGDNFFPADASADPFSANATPSNPWFG